jgi:hypothetical protein
VKTIASLFFGVPGWLRDCALFAVVLGACGAIGARIGWTALEVVYRVIFIVIGKILDLLNGNAWAKENHEQ